MDNLRAGTQRVCVVAGRRMRARERQTRDRYDAPKGRFDRNFKARPKKSFDGPSAPCQSTARLCVGGSLSSRPRSPGRLTAGVARTGRRRLGSGRLKGVVQGPGQRAVSAVEEIRPHSGVPAAGKSAEAPAGVGPAGTGSAYTDIPTLWCCLTGLVGDFCVAGSFH